ncbi:MAG: carboxypeptidase regulatory-like domain-containing protein [Methanoregula sp.]|nr:carboxypeptidase regulatory-like domain-containing protein [Methanoregula sp.]
MNHVLLGFWSQLTGIVPPVAAFTISDSTPTRGELIELVDLSTGSPLAWTWEDSVDGYLGNTQNVQHEFTTTGEHTVFLDVSNGGGQSGTSHTYNVAPLSDILVTFRVYENSGSFTPVTDATIYVSDGQVGTGNSINGEWNTAFSEGTYTAYAVKGGYTSPFAVGFTASNAYDWLHVNLFLDAEASPTPTPTPNGTWTFVPTPTSGPTAGPTPGPTTTPSPGSDYAAVLTLDVRDAQTGYYVPAAEVGIKNTTSGIWQNTTTTTGTETFTTTANTYPLSVGQPVTLAASKTGYNPASTFIHIPDNVYRAYLNLVPTTATPSPGYFSLQVSVVSDENGGPINGATVTVDDGSTPLINELPSGQSKKTNTAGSAFFQNVPAGEWQVTVTADNFASTTLYVSGVSGESKSLEFYLFEEIVIIDEDLITACLDVKNAITGVLIGGATVGIQNTSTGIWRNSTIPQGAVDFQSTGISREYPLSVGQTIRFAASAYGYVPNSMTYTIPYDMYLVTLNLMPTSVTPATGYGTLVVNVVRNKDGLPVSGATISVDDTPLKIAASNGAGTATFFNVTAGTRTITASTPFYSQVTKSTTISSGETQFVTIQVVEIGQTPVPTYVAPTTAVPTYNASGGQLNETGSTGLMSMMGTVIKLWPVILVLLFMKFMKSALE